MFEVDESSPQLGKHPSDLFHHIVAKLLFVSKRARLDIEATISFLCTRVLKSTQQDWSKLGKLLGYLKRTVDLPRILGANGFSSVFCWTDSSYATHQEMKGYTGGVTSFGHSVTHTKC